MTQSGRFISQDDVDYADYQSIGGLNLYAYCNNNPVRNSDPSGHSWKSFWKGVGNFFREVGNWFSKTFGFGLNISNETAVDFYYYLFYETENGLGYDRVFNNNKPVNFSINIPNKFWKFWNYSLGIDVNSNGKGFGLSLGTKVAVTIHNQTKSHDFYVNGLGRIGHKIALKDAQGKYSYTKTELNGIEIFVMILALVYGGAYGAVSVGACAMA